MAFGGRELRLILSIRSYGTTEIQRLRRDILSLSASTKAANVMQAAVQDHIVRKSQQLVRIQDRIAAIEQGTAARRLTLASRAERSNMRFAQRRASVAQKEVALANAAAAKRLQIGRTQDRAVAMQGSGMERLAVQEARLGTTRMRIQNQIAAQGVTQLNLESRTLSNKASILGAERRLIGLRGKNVDLERMATGSLSGFGRRTKELAFRYRAALKSSEALLLTQRQLPKQAALLEAQLGAINQQERLITAQKLEQAAAIGRQMELVALQQGQLAAIETRQAEIQAEIAMIDKEEALVNKELAQQLALLEEENIQLQRAKVQAGELAGEIALGQGPMMARAKAADAMIARQNKLLRLETQLRTVSQGFRAMQFGGLLGTALFSVTAASFANFNKQLVLAATQARDIDAPLAQVGVRAKQIQDGIHGAGVDIEGITDLMQQFPASGEDMAKAAYDIYSSMDVSFGGGLKLLKSFNQLAVATGQDLEIAVDAGITVLNNFGAAGGNVNKQLNLMASIIRFGRMRLEDLNAMFQKVAPAATAAGQSLEDVAGAMVTITRLQPSQRVGATGIARLLQTFRDPDFQKGAFKFGVDITRGAGAVGRLKPLPDIIKTMAQNFGLFQKFGGPGQLFQELTAVGRGRGIGRASRIEAQNAFTFFVGHWRQYLKWQRKATTDAGEFTTALKAMSDAPGVRWDIFINQMRAFILIIGEAALPVLLKFADYLRRAAQWFEGLNKGTRNTIIGFLALTSILALFMGTIGNVGLSLATAVINIQLMRMGMANLGVEAQATSLKVAYLNMALKGLMGIGLISIPIILQLIRGGDPGLWGFLSAAGFGAMGGAMIGSAFGQPLIGAAVGALTVPLVVEVISDFQQPAKSAAEEAYGQYRKEFQKGEPGWKKFIRNTFIAPVGGDVPQMSKGLLSFDEWLRKHPRLWKQHKEFLKKHSEDEGDLYEQWQKKTDQFIKDQLKAQTKLQKAYDKQDRRLSETQQRELQLQQAHTDAVQQAMENRNNKIEQAVQNLLQIYDQLEQQNRAAFGGFGQGPMMQGMFGSIFTGLNDLLRQFGVQIPIPFALIRKDFDLQMKYFKRWRGDLNKLLKRGAPVELVQEIQAMGPEAGIPLAEGLLSGGKKGWNSLINQWEQGQKLLKQATDRDLDVQLKEWERFGKDAAWAMINGLINNPRQMELNNKFKGYIKRNYGDILADEFAKEVAEAMAQAIEDLDAGTLPTTDGKTGKAGAKPKRLTPLQRNIRELARVNEQIRKINLSPASADIKEAMKDPLIHRQRYLRKQIDLANIRTILRQERRQRDAHERATGKMTITYHGDTITVNAGASAEDVLRIFNRRDFRRRNKTRRKP